MEEDQALIRPFLRPFFFSLGWVSFALGVLGAFLPLLPTTPFLILSAFLFSKTSPQVHGWLLSLPTFGPMIKDWEAKGVIRPKAKILALSLLAIMIGTSLAFASIHISLKIMLLCIWISVSLFILTRPSQ